MDIQIWNLGSWDEFIELKGKREGLILAVNSLKLILLSEEEPLQKY